VGKRERLVPHHVEGHDLVGAARFAREGEAAVERSDVENAPAAQILGQPQEAIEIGNVARARREFVADRQALVPLERRDSRAQITGHTDRCFPDGRCAPVARERRRARRAATRAAQRRTAAGPGGCRRECA
jgi:hypothetical protein